MTHFRSRWWVGVLGISGACVWGSGPTVSAQFVGAMPENRPAARGAQFHPDASFTAESLLRTAAQHVQNQQWAEAIDLYQRVLHEFGDTVTQLPKDDPAADPKGVRNCSSMPARTPIGGWPRCRPRRCALYRRRLDPQAEPWFREGAARRDASLLRKVVDEAFCSSFGDDALDQLGDLAFQQGRFREALADYRQIAPDPAAPAGGLVHPDPDVDRARVAAKILLCRAALGTSPPTPAELDAFATQYPNAQGLLAGRNGPLSRSLAAAIQTDQLSPPAAPDSRWPTFAGAPLRSRIATQPLDVGSLQWKVRLEPVAQARSMAGPMVFAGHPQTTAQRPDRGLAYYPIVVGDQVVLCDAEPHLCLQSGRPGGLAGRRRGR